MSDRPEKLTDQEKAAARRLLTAFKTWWHRPIDQDRVELNDLVEAFDEARDLDLG